jgi:UDP-glucose 4-epimerase
VLITGAASPLGAQLALALADDPRIEQVIGLDSRAAPEWLTRRVVVLDVDLRRGGDLVGLLRRAAPHVVVHHDVVQYPEPGRQARTLHDRNVIGTLQLLAACGRLPGLAGLVVRGSAALYGAGAGAPAFFTEELGADARHATPFQRDVASLERLVEAFARRNPTVTCTVLRLQPLVGAGLDTPLMRLLRSPVIPTFLGFDPRLQVVHADDAVAAVAAAVHTPVRGPVNIAADGTVSLKRVLRRLGRTAVPIAGPLYGPAVGLLSRATRLPRLDDDAVRYLRYGRGVDTTRMRRELGFSPAHSTVEAIDAVARELQAPAAAVGA